jgi:predicted RNA-binding protein with PUA-like domain
MAKQHWLVKQEPTKYSFDDLLADQRTMWDGVRNFQARNNLRAMRAGDAVLFYHSNVGQEVVGICAVAKAAYPDPTIAEGDWVVVDLVPKKKLAHGVTLEQIKATPALKDVGLIRQSRLSVMPLTKAEYDAIVKLGG